MSSALDQVLYCLEGHPEGFDANQIWVELSQKGENYRFNDIIRSLNHALLFDQIRMEKRGNVNLYFFLPTSEG